ncbi:hypothetical protein [Paenibacillus odorifer]|uniref:hypothetical protein n=1 Tax=Paenibacillus odorifer TaxID=189426 RepID=UPI0011C928B1|nr:hypothetical protein [Paenibacillus odorifer]
MIIRWSTTTTTSDTATATMISCRSFRTPMTLFTNLSPFQQSIGLQCSYSLETGSYTVMFPPIGAMRSDNTPNGGFSCILGLLSPIPPKHSLSLSDANVS